MQYITTLPNGYLFNDELSIEKTTIEYSVEPVFYFEYNDLQYLIYWEHWTDCWTELHWARSVKFKSKKILIKDAQQISNNLTELIYYLSLLNVDLDKFFVIV